MKLISNQQVNSFIHVKCDNFTPDLVSVAKCNLLGSKYQKPWADVHGGFFWGNDGFFACKLRNAKFLGIP